MSYDAASFQAGFALGRMLWRPPTMYIGQDTGLGWSADPEYLRYSAGADLGRNNYSSYTKRYDGWAIAIWEQRAANNGLPILMSTDRNAAYTSASWLYTGVDSAGHTWYIGTGAGEQGPGVNSGGLMVHDGWMTPYTETATIDYICQLANVRWRTQ